jgi:hypothetical protein
MFHLLHKKVKKYQARAASLKVKHANIKAGKQVVKQAQPSEVLEEVAMVEACGNTQ